MLIEISTCFPDIKYKSMNLKLVSKSSEYLCVKYYSYISAIFQNSNCTYTPEHLDELRLDLFFTLHNDFQDLLLNQNC